MRVAGLPEGLQQLVPVRQPLVLLLMPVQAR
jgi:hypothetical protein